MLLSLVYSLVCLNFGLCSLFEDNTRLLAISLGLFSCLKFRIDYARFLQRQMRSLGKGGPPVEVYEPPAYVPPSRDG
jgi:hypothetical protein